MAQDQWRGLSQFGVLQVVNPGPFEDKYQNTEQTDALMRVYYEAVTADTESTFEQKRAELRGLSATLSSYLDLH